MRAPFTMRPQAIHQIGTLVVVLVASSAVLAWPPGGNGGGKGGGNGGGGEDPPPPPPLGVIYFTGAVDGEVTTYELVPDGSSVQQVSELDGLNDPSDPYTVAYPYGGGFPTNWTYGADGHRWWIYFRLIRTENPTPTSTRYFYDLFATPDGVTEIRVTNFSDDNIVINLNSKPPAWATGSDAFISFMGGDVDDFVHRLYRVWISADDLEAEYNGTPTVTLPVVPTDAVITEIVLDAPTISGANFRHHTWSPDGNQVVFVMDDGVSADRETLWRLDLDTDVIEPIFADSTSSPHIRWSRDGSLIASADLGDILVMDPNVPGSEVVVVDGSIGAPYTHPLWAPDGSQIAFLQKSYSKRHKQNQYKIYSISLDDGSVREIGKNSDPLSYKRLLEWTEE